MQDHAYCHSLQVDRLPLAISWNFAIERFMTIEGKRKGRSGSVLPAQIDNTLNAPNSSAACERITSAPLSFPYT